MIKLGPIIEIILYVEDMESQVRFYRDVMGIDLVFPQGLDDYGDQMWVTFDTGVCTLALHGGGQLDFGPDAPKFVFEVEKIEEVRQELLDRRVLMGPVRRAAPGVLVCDGQDPEGNKFSIESRLAT
jgi:catechol 2,3-dioxygenase-like lactoylglutathione lyase family enzyme